MSQLHLRAEQEIVNALNSIKFKKMLIEFDRDSRDVLLSKCIHWFICNSHLDVESEKVFQWFQQARAENSYLEDKEFRCSVLWGTLHHNLSSSVSFLKLVQLFL
jgi:dipeptidase